MIAGLDVSHIIFKFNLSLFFIRNVIVHLNSFNDTQFNMNLNSNSIPKRLILHKMAPSYSLTKLLLKFYAFPPEMRFEAF